MTEQAISDPVVTAFLIAFIILFVLIWRWVRVLYAKRRRLLLEAEAFYESDTNDGDNQ